jgi:hypothetical protein
MPPYSRMSHGGLGQVKRRTPMNTAAKSSSAMMMLNM